MSLCCRVGVLQLGSAKRFPNELTDVREHLAWPGSSLESRSRRKLKVAGLEGDRLVLQGRFFFSRTSSYNVLRARNEISA